MRYGWQACAALYAAFSLRNFDNGPLDAHGDGIDEQDVIEQAVASRDEHAIKFTEACLREYRVSYDPAFIAAARDASKRLAR